MEVKNTLTKIEKSIIEIYGKEYSLEIMERLNFRYKNYIDFL